jgi:hypothetical protein
VQTQRCSPAILRPLSPFFLKKQIFFPPTSRRVLFVKPFCSDSFVFAGELRARLAASAVAVEFPSHFRKLLVRVFRNFLVGNNREEIGLGLRGEGAMRTGERVHCAAVLDFFLSRWWP